MSVQKINQIFETDYQSWDEVSRTDLLRMLVALMCAEYNVKVLERNEIA